MTASEPHGPAAPSPGSPRPVVAVFTSHWLAMAGLALLLSAIVAWTCLLSVELRGGRENPYIGVGMACVAVVFTAGLVLTPLGLALGRRRLRQRLADGTLDVRTAWRRLLAFLLLVSVVNVGIASQMSLRVAHAMESRAFCGSCHVMTPEARAFEHGPHAGILCVDCHVGDGALGYLESKVQGARQLLSVLTGRVATPIEGAIESGRMVPSAETCEGCHWKDQPAAASLRLYRRYQEDEANTPTTTLLTMNVGGSRMGGIHGAHHGDGIEVRFVATDAQRQDIPLVEYVNERTGVRRTYVRKGVDAATLADRPRITMQCFDCHNRPAHAFQLPGPAVDEALTLGRMAADLPFLKKTAVELLRQEYPSTAAAAAGIPAGLSAYYEEQHPEVARARAADVAAAGAVLAEIHARNVYPELGVTWGTYPDNRGHEDWPGCFRCHAGEHVAATGEEITKNCFRCHFPASVEETKPEVLELLGVDRLLRELQAR